MVRRSALVMPVGALFLLLLAARGQAQDDVSLTEVIEEAVFADLPTRPSRDYLDLRPTGPTVMDPVDDREFSTGEPPGLSEADALDIEGVTLEIIEVDPGGILDTGFLPGLDSLCAPRPERPLPPLLEGPGLIDVFCPPARIDGPSTPVGPMLVSTIGLTGRRGVNENAIGSYLSSAASGAVCEWVHWYRVEPGPPAFERLPDFPRDPADGMNRAIGLRVTSGELGMLRGGDEPVITPFALTTSGDASGFQPFPTASVVVADEDEIAFYTPAAELDGVVAANTYTFCTDGSYTAEGSAADQTSAYDLDIEALPTFTFSLEPEAGEIEPSPVASAPEATEAEAEPTEAATLAGGNLEGGSFSELLWIPIVIGGVLVTYGAIRVYHRTRERRKRDTGPTWWPFELGEGFSWWPPSFLRRDADDDEQECDWALYFDDDGVRRLLRAPKGVECCAYDISIETTVDDDAREIGARQDIDPDEDARLRIPGVDLTWAGLDLRGSASARSGPAGRLDWMDGDGDPRRDAGTLAAAAGQHIQRHPHDEPHDPWAELFHEETTRVRIRLESRCPGHENTYTADGRSTASIEADQECTNAAGSTECPIEFGITASAATDVTRDLFYSAHEGFHEGGDEVEPKRAPALAATAAGRPPGQLDAHDHATRPRDHYEMSSAGSDQSVRDSDDLDVDITSRLLVEAGTIVPRAVWSHTERVTARARGELSHELIIDGQMERHDCLDGPCLRPVCKCAPAFSLLFRDGRARLTADGVDVVVFRDPDTPDSTWFLAR